MRSIKMIVPLAMAALTIAALAAPSLAGASTWTKNGAGIQNPHWTSEGKQLAESSSVGVEGAFNTTSSYGGANCSLSASGTLTPTASGSLTKFTLSSCTLTGGLKSLCTGVASVSTGTMSVQTNGNTITIPDFAATYNMQGSAFCPKTVVAEGAVTLTPANKAAISSVTLSGTLFSPSLGVKMSVSGTPSLTPAGQYGIANSELVQVAGEFGFLNSSGSLSCPVSVDIELEPGSTGKVVSVSSSAVDCDLGGGLSTGCGVVNSFTTSGLPWKVEDTRPTITVSGATFSWKTAKCGFPFSEGTLTLTPDSPDAISSIAAVSGKSSVWPGTWQSWGSWSFNPAGVFGL